MISQRTTRRAPPCGFTVTELLNALALIVFIMMLLSQAFSAAVDNFSNLKSIGDQAEQFRTAGVTLSHDLDETNFETWQLVFNGLRTRSVDPNAAAALRAQYEAIAASAADLDAQLQAVEPQIVDPAEKGIIGRARDDLDLIRLGATVAAELLGLIEDDSSG